MRLAGSERLLVPLSLEAGNYVVRGPQRQQVVAGLVKVVRDLGIQPLAEGIEHPEYAEVCRQIGFTLAQGYLFGKPLPAESVPE